MLKKFTLLLLSGAFMFALATVAYAEIQVEPQSGDTLVAKSSVVTFKDAATPQIIVAEKTGPGLRMKAAAEPYHMGIFAQKSIAPDIAKAPESTLPASRTLVAKMKAAPLIYTEAPLKKPLLARAAATSSTHA